MLGIKQLPTAPVIKAVEEIPPNAVVRYLYYPGKQEGGTVRRAIDPVWSVDVYEIEKRKNKFQKVNGKKVTTLLYTICSTGPRDRSFDKSFKSYPRSV